MTYIGSGFSLWDHARFEGDAEGSASASGGGAYGQEGLNAAAASVSGTGPSPSSPAGGAQAASGGPGSTSYGPAPAGNVGYGPSPSSPAGGAQAASSYGPGNDGASVGYGPSPSSPAGGAQAAAGYGPTGYGPSPAESIGYGPSPSSPAGGAQAAAGYGPAAYSPTGFGPSPASPAGGAQAASGFTPTGGLMPGLTPTGYTPGGFTAPDTSARAAETQSMNQYNAYQNILGLIAAAENNLENPYDVVVGGRNANLTDMTIAEVMDMQRTMPERNSLNSTAVGQYQVIASTLAAAVDRLGLNPNTTMFTPAIQDMIAMDLVDQRANQAARSPTGLTPESLAAALSQEWAGLPTSSGRSYYDGVNNNAATVTYGPLAAAAQDLVDSGLYSSPSGRSIAAATPANSSNVGLPSLGPVPESRPAPTVATSPQEQRTMQEYAYAGLTRSLAPANPVTYSPEQAGRMVAEVANPTTAEVDSQTFADKYLSTPEVAPVPSDRPAQPTQAATAPETPSLGGKIAAGAIDVGLGLIPGVGIGAGLFNAGAQLTGNPTLGERAVDMFQNAPGPTGEQNVAENDGAGLGRERAGKAEDDAETETSTPAERFERTYLYVRDLPTPQQRWGRAA